MFLDTNIFIYAAGRDSPFKGRALGVLKKVVNSGAAVEYSTSVEVLQELLHYYTAKSERKKGFELVDYVLRLGLNIWPVELSDITFARSLMARYQSLATRDAVHAAVALRRNISEIISFDHDFDMVVEMRRIEP